jgi:hypothetical protein
MIAINPMDTSITSIQTAIVNAVIEPPRITPHEP